MDLFLRTSLATPGATSGPGPSENGGGNAWEPPQPFPFRSLLSHSAPAAGALPTCRRGPCLQRESWGPWLQPAWVPRAAHSPLARGCLGPCLCWGRGAFLGLPSLSLPPAGASIHQTLTCLAVPPSSVISSRKPPETLFLWASARLTLYVCCGQGISYNI